MQVTFLLITNLILLQIMETDTENNWSEHYRLEAYHKFTQNLSGTVVRATAPVSFWNNGANSFPTF
jgi:hypothetical protein